MFNKILVPLDGSKLSESAIPFVEEIILGAKEDRKIEIFLLQVVPTKVEFVPTYSAEAVRVPYSESERGKSKKEVSEYLSKVGAGLKSSPSVTVTPIVKIGDDAAEQILKASDELKVDLIVISTHGRSGISRWAFGSVADKILRGGNTPVFMVRASQNTLDQSVQ